MTTTLVTLWAALAAVANDAETVANLILIFAACRWGYGWRWVKLSFTDGENTHVVQMRHRDINAQSLTNVVSARFYGGGMIPANVRAQIVAITNPPTK